jgi:hypothetical protein
MMASFDHPDGGSNSVIYGAVASMIDFGMTLD